MKKYSSAIVLALLVSVIVFAHSCSKKTEEEPPLTDCKTCKAFGNNGSVTEKRVCSPAEETAFRNENAGKEISCR